MRCQANKFFLCSCSSLLLMGRLLPGQICWDPSRICFVNIPTFRWNFTLFSVFAFPPQGCLILYFYLFFTHIKMLGGLWQGMKFNLPWDQTLTQRCLCGHLDYKREESVFYLYGRLLKISFVAIITLMTLVFSPTVI